MHPKTFAEKQFCVLGPIAEAFITGATAASNTRLGPELADLNTLRAAHGEQPVLDALSRAVAFGRWRAGDVRSILAAGAGTVDPSPAGDALVLQLPVVPQRSLSDYAIGQPERREIRREHTTAPRCPLTSSRGCAGSSNTATFDYLASLKWVTTQENLCLAAGT